MQLLVDSKNIIMRIGDELREQTDRYILDGVVVFKRYKTQDIDGNITINVVTAYAVEEIPAEVIPGKYCYTVDEGFYLNPDYVEPPKSLEEQIEDLKQELIDTEIALCELADIIVTGGE